MTNRETAFTNQTVCPPIEIQQEIVADLEENLRAVEEARRLKAKMKGKIHATIDRVWGKIRACYLHACLKYVQRSFMTNTTLRERFGIDDKNSATASRIIEDTTLAGFIRCHDDSVGSKAKKYLPWWA
jgi:arginase family enzyme